VPTRLQILDPPEAGDRTKSGGIGSGSRLSRRDDKEEWERQREEIYSFFGLTPPRITARVQAPSPPEADPGASKGGGKNKETTNSATCA
jgi:hypothetical protein